jgi:integrase
MRKQRGQIIRIGDRWYVRYWERRNIGGTVERKRVTHSIGEVTTRGTRPPADIRSEAEQHMATVNSGSIPAERIATIGDFVEGVYLPWIERYQRPSTLKGYRQVWRQHLKPLCEGAWLKEVRTYQVQSWLNAIGKNGSVRRRNAEDARLSKNSLKRIQSALSGVFSLAKQLGYYDGLNPLQDTRVDPRAAEPAETYAYSLEEVQALLAVLPEPAATAFAVAAFMGLRIGEIEALRWEDYREGEMHISRSIWNGHVGAPKTRKSAAPVPVIRQLAERLEMHQLHSQNPQSGPIFANSSIAALSAGKLMAKTI